MLQTKKISQPRFWFGQKITTWLGLRYLVVILVSLVVLIPLVMAAIGGLKTTGELYLDPMSFPANPRWQNYTSILGSNAFWRPMLNSLIVLVWVTLGVVTVSTLAAFIFARLTFPGREVVFNFFMLGLLFPTSVAVLPLFVTLRSLNLLDSLTGVILVEIAFGLPGNILLLRGFLRTAVPGEVEEAAYIDGCGIVGFFWRILIPLARPALAAVAVLTMVASWNAYFLPLLVLNDQTQWTLPLGISQFQGQYGSDWALVMAFVTLALIPSIIFYLIAERHIVAGLTAGAVKG